MNMFHNVEHNELCSLHSTVWGVKYRMGWSLGRMGEARNILIYHWLTDIGYVVSLPLCEPNIACMLVCYKHISLVEKSVSLWL